MRSMRSDALLQVLAHHVLHSTKRRLPFLHSVLKNVPFSNLNLCGQVELLLISEAYRTVSVFTITLRAAMS